MNRHLFVFSSSLLTFALSACFLLDASARSKAADYAVNKRVVIHASAEEQAHVLTEMNGFLSSLHTINAALALKDFALVAKTALMHGPHHFEKSTIELSFEAKAPAEWRVFASPMRKGFAEVAKAAQNDPNVERVAVQLGKVTQNCVACHATFKIVVQ